mmetsp:Transcript_9049/g.37026  ORF Transcript_9049/g.37026 Transcript_9049/m.37026 type:complete len:228 (+) Transcript_9049:866-1549(+)
MGAARAMPARGARTAPLDTVAGAGVVRDFVRMVREYALFANALRQAGGRRHRRTAASDGAGWRQPCSGGAPAQRGVRRCRVSSRGQLAGQPRVHMAGRLGRPEAHLNMYDGARWHLRRARWLRAADGGVVGGGWRHLQRSDGRRLECHRCAHLGGVPNPSTSDCRGPCLCLRSHRGGVERALPGHSEALRGCGAPRSWWYRNDDRQSRGVAGRRRRHGGAGARRYHR